MCHSSSAQYLTTTQHIHVYTNLCNRFLALIPMINDIYPGRSTHAKVVLREALYPVKLEFGNVDFWQEGKTGEPGEKPLGAE